MSKLKELANWLGIKLDIPFTFNALSDVYMINKYGTLTKWNIDDEEFKWSDNNIYYELIEKEITYLEYFPKSDIELLKGFNAMGFEYLVRNHDNRVYLFKGKPAAPWYENQAQFEQSWRGKDPLIVSGFDWASKEVNQGLYYIKDILERNSTFVEKGKKK